MGKIIGGVSRLGGGKKSVEESQAKTTKHIEEISLDEFEDTLYIYIIYFSKETNTSILDIFNMDAFTFLRILSILIKSQNIEDEKEEVKDVKINTSISASIEEITAIGFRLEHA